MKFFFGGGPSLSAIQAYNVELRDGGSASWIRGSDLAITCVSGNCDGVPFHTMGLMLYTPAAGAMLNVKKIVICKKNV